MKHFIISKYQQVKALYKRFERYLMPATLLGGFLVDYITFTTIQIEITLILLLVYWIVTGLTMLFISFYDAGKISTLFKYVRLFSPLLLQFTFGALLGGSLIFYWFSSAFSISWPFIFAVAILMISNEIFKDYFLRPVVQVCVYFFVTISLVAVALPFLFHSLSPWLFVWAGLISLGILYVYIRILSFTDEAIEEEKAYFFALIVIIFLVMNFLYFANIIPPIPLSLREAGMYHNIKVAGKTYTMQGEVETFWQQVIPGQVLHLKQLDKIYFYTAIFAPSKLSTVIVHDWQYYDTVKKEWVSKNKLSFTIVGGRQEGYKGYSWNYNLAPGDWRIYVENEQGQVLGRMKFTIERVTEAVKLNETIR